MSFWAAKQPNVAPGCQSGAESSPEDIFIGREAQVGNPGDRRPDGGARNPDPLTGWTRLRRAILAASVSIARSWAIQGRLNYFNPRAKSFFTPPARSIRGRDSPIYRNEAVLL